MQPLQPSHSSFLSIHSSFLSLFSFFFLISFCSFFCWFFFCFFFVLFFQAFPVVTEYVIWCASAPFYCLVLNLLPLLPLFKFISSFSFNSTFYSFFSSPTIPPSSSGMFCSTSSSLRLHASLICLFEEFPSFTSKTNSHFLQLKSTQFYFTLFLIFHKDIVNFNSCHPTTYRFIFLHCPSLLPISTTFIIPPSSSIQQLPRQFHTKPSTPNPHQTHTKPTPNPHQTHTKPTPHHINTTTTQHQHPNNITTIPQ